MDKLKAEHKHILKLIKRNAGNDGWTPVSEQLYLHLAENIPPELAEFEKLNNGGRARLTDEGANLLKAMEWL